MLPVVKRFNLGYLCSRAAQSTLEKPAVIDLHEGMERVIRCGELERRLDRMAAVYGALGLAVGERVALLVGNRFEFVEAAYRNAGRPRCDRESA